MKASSSTHSTTSASDIVAKKAKMSDEDLGKCSGRRRGKSMNIVCLLRDSNTHGRCMKRFDQLPKEYISSYEERFKNVDSLPSNVRNLYDRAKEKDFNLKDEGLIACLEDVYDQLLNDSKVDSSAMEFCYSGGIEIIADMLVRTYYDLSVDIYQDKEIKRIPGDEIKPVNTMLQTMYLAAQVVPIGLSHLCNRPHLMHLLLSLFVEDSSRIFIESTLLLEEMVLSEPKKPSIDLRKIACLPAVLAEDLPYQQEAHLYHVLATSISVCDTHLSVETSLREHDRWLANGTRGELNRANQEHLISMEPFLEKLFQITCRQLQLHLPDLFRESIRNLSITRQISEQRLLDALTRNLQESVESPIYQNALYHEKSIRADSFLLLSMLLTGKCREEMQKNILKYKVVQGLEKSVDSIVWSAMRNSAFSDSQLDHSPVSTVKIQFLRLMYSISDHHLHRYLLLSEQELDEIKELSVAYKVPLCKEFGSIDRTNCCAKHPGLMTTIIKKIREQPGTSYIRFWMTRALESFLRGTVCRIDQIFFIKKGLLDELFRILLSNENTSTEVVQGHFDLLASLMKGNVFAFEKFSEIVDCHGLFQKLCDVIENNLVDSNMFIRCIVLTIDCFRTENVSCENLIENCRILKHYANMEKRVQAIVNFMKLLDVETLSQENVSCLNTSIIILLLAKKNDQLPNYLSSILHHEEEISNSGPEILRNLQELLEFWLEHYSFPFKQSDIKSLEESTEIPFVEWKSLTKDLISGDTTSPNSIVHHLASVKPNFTLKATAVPSCTRTC